MPTALEQPPASRGAYPCAGSDTRGWTETVDSKTVDGGRPRSALQRTAGEAPREEKPANVGGASPRKRRRLAFSNSPLVRKTCAREDCGMGFETRIPHKRFCSDRCQRIAERRRYRARHTEWATCKGCGERFDRSAVGERKKVYCTTDCQAESRSIEYRERDDIGRGRTATPLHGTAWVGRYSEKGAPVGGRQ